ncbi:MAG TPA: PEGA domain-containing protein [Thermoplasmata archaeon]|nr:PEGA domain-containing protein [Thermoplasmata archaeon]
MTPRNRAIAVALLLLAPLVGIGLGAVHSAGAAGLGLAVVRGTVAPHGALVQLDGRPIPVLPDTGYNQTVPAGDHELYAMLGGWQPFYDNFTLSDGQTLWINISLQQGPLNLPNFNTTGNATAPGPNWTVIFAALAFVAITLGLSVVFLRRRKKPPAPPTTRSGRPAPSSARSASGKRAKGVAPAPAAGKKPPQPRRT